MKYVISESQMVKIARRLHEEESKIEKVKKIQQFLVDNGYDLGNYGDEGDGVDGKYGRLTRKAVEEFQRKEGDLEVDGKVGPQTAKAMGVEPVFRKKTNDGKTQDKEENTNQTDNKVTKVENTGDWVKESGKRYAYHLPTDYQNKKVHLLFAGTDSSTSTPIPQRYKENIGQTGVLNNVIFVVTDYRNNLEDATKFIKDKFGKNVSSVAGFSAGGYIAWKAAKGSSYQLVGLIDPSTPENKSCSSSSSQLGPNTYMVCNPRNWGSYKGIQGRLKEYCNNDDEIENLTCNSKGHWENLEDFYSKHGNKLE